MHHLVKEADRLLKAGGFEYAIAGGYAIELFLRACSGAHNAGTRTHGDIDIAAFWKDRNAIVQYMQTLGWHVYEMCGHGLAHRITDINRQIKSKRNMFCFKEGCELISLAPQKEPDMYYLDFDHKGQTSLNFIEFLFNDRTETNFLYARNHEIALPLSSAIRIQGTIPYLAPEMVLLYKSTDIQRDGYQLDYDLAIEVMDHEQKKWLEAALTAMNPAGHKWIAGCGRRA